MIDLILAIIFFGCTISIAAIAARKMPALEQIERQPQISENKIGVAGQARHWVVLRIKQAPLFKKWFKDFSYTTFLQKLLSKVRVMMIRLENKTSAYLEKLRVQAKEKQEAAVNDNYWSDIKNLIKNKEIVKRRTTAAARRTNIVVEKVAQIKSEPARQKKNRRKKAQ
ncbi:MAG TPA: hypothetical protein P5080_00800 [Candidatus Paceibacterota bacterium]|nr:hypothetical protein [Candidatus Pacearchaeota archaeon]HRZ50515.1 hypothetical protein [Candidatus Paceibacterota bacterium]HSA36236.1 hypothetical protein [Candidatus Paceibacterota bacterium]